jgi:hypothetical protein
MSTILDRFFELEKPVYKGASYRDKSKILRHKIIGWYAKPFNPDYIKWVTTTIYPHTDFGSEIVNDPKSMLKIELHENVHKWDFRKGPIRAMLKYLFPQLYALPFIAGAFVTAGWAGLWGFLAFMVFGHVGLFLAHKNLNMDEKDEENFETVTSKGKKLFGVFVGLGALSALGLCILGAGWWSLLLVGGALFLSPWPLKARWRTAYELRGYTASLYQEWLRHGSIRPEILDRYVSKFTGSTYFFMEPNKASIRARLQFQIDRFVQSENQFLAHWLTLGSKKADAEAAEPYRMMSGFISREQLRNVQG